MAAWCLEVNLKFNLNPRFKKWIQQSTKCLLQNLVDRDKTLNWLSQKSRHRCRILKCPRSLVQSKLRFLNFNHEWSSILEYPSSNTIIINKDVVFGFIYWNITIITFCYVTIDNKITNSIMKVLKCEESVFFRNIILTSLHQNNWWFIDCIFESPTWAWSKYQNKETSF